VNIYLVFTAIVGVVLAFGLVAYVLGEHRILRSGRKHRSG